MSGAQRAKIDALKAGCRAASHLLSTTALKIKIKICKRVASAFPEHPLAVLLHAASSTCVWNGAGEWAEPTDLEHVGGAVVGVLHHHGLGPGQRVGDAVLLLVADGLQRDTHGAVSTPPRCHSQA